MFIANVCAYNRYIFYLYLFFYHRSLVIDLICDQKVEDGNLVVQGELLHLTYVS